MSVFDYDLQVLGSTTDNKYYLVKEAENIYVYEKESFVPKILKTPGGNPIATNNEELAERIISDLESYGYEYHSPSSILSWHFTYLDNFGKMEQKRVVSMLVDSFINKSDWTIDSGNQNEIILSVFGEKNVRRTEMKEWLCGLNRIQLTAVCCIGNTYHSINVAYSLYKIMSMNDPETEKQQLIRLVTVLDSIRTFGTIEDIQKDFDTFMMYFFIQE